MARAVLLKISPRCMTAPSCCPERIESRRVDNQPSVAYLARNRPHASNRPGGSAMYVWSKNIVLGLLAAFAILIVIVLLEGPGAATSHLKSHTTFWITLNYA